MVADLCPLDLLLVDDLAVDRNILLTCRSLLRGQRFEVDDAPDCVEAALLCEDLHEGRREQFTSAAGQALLARFVVVLGGVARVLLLQHLVVGGVGGYLRELAGAQQLGKHLAQELEVVLK